MSKQVTVVGSVKNITRISRTFSYDVTVGDKKENKTRTTKADIWLEVDNAQLAEISAFCKKHGKGTPYLQRAGFIIVNVGDKQLQSIDAMLGINSNCTTSGTRAKGAEVTCIFELRIAGESYSNRKGEVIGKFANTHTALSDMIVFGNNVEAAERIESDAAAKAKVDSNISRVQIGIKPKEPTLMLELEPDELDDEKELKHQELKDKITLAEKKAAISKSEKDIAVVAKLEAELEELTLEA